MFTCLDCHLLQLLEKFQNVHSEVLLNTDFSGASQKAGVQSQMKESPYLPLKVSLSFCCKLYTALRVSRSCGKGKGDGRE